MSPILLKFTKTVILMCSALILPFYFVAILKQDFFHKPIRLNETDVERNISVIFEQRLERIRDVCFQLRTSDEMAIQTKVSPIFVLKEANLAYCPIFKAATTTTMRSLIEIWKNKTGKAVRVLSNTNPKDVLTRIAHPIVKRGPFVNFQMNPNSTTFMIVRHPFQRLVSAFRDKIERLHASYLKKDFYYLNYGKKIVSRFRKAAIERFGTEFFSEDHFFGAPIQPKAKRTIDLPTFWEFVQYLKTTKVDNANEHWIPQTHYCSLCSIKFDYIIKYESLSDEIPLMWQRIGWYKNLKNESWSNPDHSPKENKELTEIYFKMLSLDDINWLKNYYRFDFLILGYEF